MNRLRHYRSQARLAWHVFRGRPLAYRVRVAGRLDITVPDTRVVECALVGAPPQPRRSWRRRLATWLREVWRR